MERWRRKGLLPPTGFDRSWQPIRYPQTPVAPLLEPKIEIPETAVKGPEVVLHALVEESEEENAYSEDEVSNLGLDWVDEDGRRGCNVLTFSFRDPTVR